MKGGGSQGLAGTGSGGQEHPSSRQSRHRDRYLTQELCPKRRQAASALFTPRPPRTEQLFIHRLSTNMKGPGQLSCQLDPPLQYSDSGKSRSLVQICTAGGGSRTARLFCVNSTTLPGLAGLDMELTPIPTACTHPQASLFPILPPIRGYLQQTALRKPWGVAPSQGKGGARRPSFQPPISILRGGQCKEPKMLKGAQ